MSVYDDPSLTTVNDDPSLTTVNDDPSLSIVNDFFLEKLHFLVGKSEFRKHLGCFS